MAKHVITFIRLSNKLNSIIISNTYAVTIIIEIIVVELFKLKFCHSIDVRNKQILLTTDC